MKDREETACIQLLLQINEILYSIILGASAFKEEIPALRKMLFRLEGMTPELRAELDVHASKLQDILAHRSQYRDDAFRPRGNGVRSCIETFSPAWPLRRAFLLRLGQWVGSLPTRSPHAAHYPA